MARGWSKQKPLEENFAAHLIDTQYRFLSTASASLFSSKLFDFSDGTLLAKLGLQLPFTLRL